jgi:hypothetical protein
MVTSLQAARHEAPWDAAALSSLTSAMTAATAAIWPRHRRRVWLYGGWAVVLWLFTVLYWVTLKAMVWMLIEMLLLEAAAGVLLAGGCWRLYRLARGNPVRRV